MILFLITKTDGNDKYRHNRKDVNYRMLTQLKTDYCEKVPASEKTKVTHLMTHF